MAAWGQVAAATLLLIAFAVVAARVGSAAWRRGDERLISGLVRSDRAPRDARIDFGSLEGLPEPVARYLRSALGDGRLLIALVRFTQTGELRSDPAVATWSSFVARQVVVPSAPGFLWDARVRAAPWLEVRVRDSYVAGRGRARVGLWSTVAVASETGGTELNSAALLRYLAEAAWYPTALLPGSGVVWTPIDSSRARAELTDMETTVSLEFRFRDSGAIDTVYSEGRYRRVGNAYQLTPWRGRYSAYREVAGWRVPARGEVEWLLDGAWQPVWRGELADFEYQLAD